jgi:hypothetical protein
MSDEISKIDTENIGYVESAAGVPASPRETEHLAEDYGRSKNTVRQDDGSLSFLESIRYEIAKGLDVAGEVGWWTVNGIKILAVLTAIKNYFRNNTMNVNVITNLLGLVSGIALTVAHVLSTGGVTVESIITALVPVILGYFIGKPNGAPPLAKTN